MSDNVKGSVYYDGTTWQLLPSTNTGVYTWEQLSIKPFKTLNTEQFEINNDGLLSFKTNSNLDGKILNILTQNNLSLLITNENINININRIDTNYVYYKFIHDQLTNDYTEYTLTFNQNTICDILIIGGGGGGGGGSVSDNDGNGGGGGAGGLVFLPNHLLNGSYKIKVGKGGIGTNGIGDNGITSSIEKNSNGVEGIDNFYALGGGGGGNGITSAGYSGNGSSGGSGGGGGGNSESSGGQSSQNLYNGKGFGNNGGNSTTSAGDQSAGGGGAGGEGQNSYEYTGQNVGGEGGIGLHKVTIDGTEYIFKDLFGINVGEYIQDSSTIRNIGTAQDYFNLYYENGKNTSEDPIPTVEEGIYFAGGGAGKTDRSTTGELTLGGLGGGGSSKFSTGEKTNGIDGTGGGGAGLGKHEGYESVGTDIGTNGGSGIVLIRFKYREYVEESIHLNPATNFTEIQKHNLLQLTTLPIPVITNINFNRIDLDYVYYKFLHDQSTNDYTEYQINFTDNIVCDILIVAGGGGGGCGGGTSTVGGAGGGAGGLIYKENYTFNGIYTIKIGRGGNGSINTSTVGPENGQDSSIEKNNGIEGIDNFIAKGGGAGGKRTDDQTGKDGGSGGGAVGDASAGNALQPTSLSGGFGNNGGASITAAPGGGGGAGSAGGDGSRDNINIRGNGGDGKKINIINKNEDVYYAGGGGAGLGGSTHNNDNGLGGLGGGGNGFDNVNYTNKEDLNATPHTGGGGGGGSNTATNIDGGNGGSGIIIIKFIYNKYSEKEVKIPNFSYGIEKSIVTITNNTTGSDILNTLVYDTTPAIKNNIISNPTIQPNIIDDNYNYLMFTYNNSGNYTDYTVNISQKITCDILIIGGGGGGGTRFGGGGGAGLLIYKTNYDLEGIISIRIGKGGLGSQTVDTANNGNNGEDTIVISSTETLTAIGGGGGGAESKNGYSGGSGGGGSWQSSVGGNGNGDSITSFGYNGGNGGTFNSKRVNGGGGGAGGPGKGNALERPDGGKGKLINITGIPIYYAGGGGGANSDHDTNGYDATGEGGENIGNGWGGMGGGGGGDGGESYPLIPAQDGAPNSGGGGGGGTMSKSVGGNGGSGVVIIKYLKNIQNEIKIPKDNLKGYLHFNGLEWSIDKTKDTGTNILNNLMFDINYSYSLINITSLSSLNINQIDNNYNNIIFTYTSDTIGLTGQTEYIINIDREITCDILIVGGGGGGGADNSGGGGAGGLVFLENEKLNGNILIRVGKGGNGAASGQSGSGFNGYDSILNGFIANGGGGGGTGQSNSSIASGKDGGSGGGAAFETSTASGTPGLSIQNEYIKNNIKRGWGFNGGLGLISSSGQGSGGGGGGANENGINSKTEGDKLGGRGGDGKFEIYNKDFKSLFNLIDTSIGEHIENKVYFAGGGGAGNDNAINSIDLSDNSGKSNRGGKGGGGSGGYNSSNAGGKNALNNTGGGGGGTTYHTANVKGGDGGSGIIIIRYNKYYTIETKTPKDNVNGYLHYNGLEWSIDKSNSGSDILNKLVNNITPATEINITTSININEIDNYHNCLIFTYTSDSTGLIGQTEYIINTNNKEITCDILIVGGGGGGGSDNAGGGGAGGLVFLENQKLNGEIVIRVGKGGNGGVNGSSLSENGKNSLIQYSDETNNFTALGGGYGGMGDGDNTGGDGGSGGGGAAEAEPATGGIGLQPTYSTIGFGNNGGNGGSGGDKGGGGGGGAGTIGRYAGYLADNSSYGGAGGEGLYIINNKNFKTHFNLIDTTIGEHKDGNVYFAGGGGAGNRNSIGAMYMTDNSGYKTNRGGWGGGGLGGQSSGNEKGQNGKNNTGGGGGGGYLHSSVGDGGMGGSGIVIIRYFKYTPEIKTPKNNINGYLHYDGFDWTIDKTKNTGDTILDELIFDYFEDTESIPTTLPNVTPIIIDPNLLINSSIQEKYLKFEYDPNNDNGDGQTEYTLNFPKKFTCDILLVGGGGSGGSYGGGGGGGDVIYETNIELNGNYLIKVGKGGDSQTKNTSPYLNGNEGKNSIIYEIKDNNNIPFRGAGGGGGGGGWGLTSINPIPIAINYGGKQYGSQGGGGGGSPGLTANNIGAISSFSGNGGNTSGNNNQSGGGGGGSKSDGLIGYYIDSTNYTGGNGGNGDLINITGTSEYYGGGGGGGGGGSAGNHGGFIGGFGGLGGGGKGQSRNETDPNKIENNIHGIDGKGGGGGAMTAVAIFSNLADNKPSGRGGSGVIIIRYKNPIIKTNKNNVNGYLQFDGTNWKLTNSINYGGITTIDTYSSILTHLVSEVNNLKSQINTLSIEPYITNNQFLLINNNILIQEPEVISNNLIIWYKFDNNLENSALIGNIGSLQENGTSVQFIDTEGNYKFGKSAFVNNTILTIPDFNFNNLTESLTKSFTISFWFKPNDISNTWNLLFDASNYSGYTAGIRTYINSTDKKLYIYYYYNNAPNNNNILSLNGNFTDNVWRLYTFVWIYISDQNNIYNYDFSFYENGIINGGINRQIILSDSQNGFQIGHGDETNNNYSYPIVGFYDDFRIYNKALSGTEIANLYNYHTLVIPYSLYTDYTQSLQSLAEFKTGVKGWTHYRHLPASSSSWFSGEDNALGSFTKNETTKLENEEWAISWTNGDELLFSKDNFATWLRINKTDITSRTGWFWDQTPLGISTGSVYSIYIETNNYQYQHSPFIFVGTQAEHSINNMIYQEYSDKPSSVSESEYPYKGNSLNVAYDVFVRSSTDTETVINSLPEYKILTFTHDGSTDDQTSYTINFSEETTCDILIVGGGGGGGATDAGGGGAGGLIYETGLTLNGTYTIKVGKGGIGGAGGANVGNNPGLKGKNSQIEGGNTIINYDAVGGGGGGSGYPNDLEPNPTGGGSSGGLGTSDTTRDPANVHVDGQGYSGGIGIASGQGGGSGGGAGGPGIDGNTIEQADGGIGKKINITGSEIYYAGGGGGGHNYINNTWITTSGGLGGGGRGSGLGNGYDATYYGGGGGGGGGNWGAGGDGYEGIVIIRYKMGKNTQTFHNLFKNTNNVILYSTNITYDNDIITIPNLSIETEYFTKSLDISNGNKTVSVILKFIKPTYSTRMVPFLNNPSFNIYLSNQIAKIDLSTYYNATTYTIIFYKFMSENNITLNNSILTITDNYRGTYDLLIKFDEILYVFRIYERIDPYNNYYLF
jgi:hypothetical protein